MVTTNPPVSPLVGLCTIASDIVGFYFLEQSSNYKPPKELSDFLAAGDAPIYIGYAELILSSPGANTRALSFGSVVVEDAKEMSSQPAIISTSYIH